MYSYVKALFPRDKSRKNFFKNLGYDIPSAIKSKGLMNWHKILCDFSMHTYVYNLYCTSMQELQKFPFCFF